MTLSRDGLNLAVSALSIWGQSAHQTPDKRLHGLAPNMTQDERALYLSVGLDAILASEHNVSAYIERGTSSNHELWRIFEADMSSQFPWMTRKSRKVAFYCGTYSAYKEGLLATPLSAPLRTPMEWVRSLFA